MENVKVNPDTATGEESQAAGEQQNTQEEVKTFTQDEVNDIVQKRLVKQRERLSKAFQEERQTSDLEERERNITKRELKADVLEKLAGAGLPSSLAELINYDNAEDCEKSLKEVGAIFNQSLSEAIKHKARQSTPTESGGSGWAKPDRLAQAFGVKR